MAEILGPQTILALGLPTGVDGDRIAKWHLRDGTSFQSVVQQLSLALGDLNQEFVNRYGYMMSLTEDIMMEYPQGGAVTELPEITDASDYDAVGGETIGHMIDLRVYGGGVGGSKRYFRDSRPAKINADISTIVKQAKWRFEKKLYNRLFTNTEFAVGSGYNVPFVNGTAGNVDYQPPAYAGEEFATTHTHFIGVDSDTLGFDTAIENIVETLVEHGHEAPFDVLVSKTDVDAGAYLALAKFVQLKSNVIQVVDRGGATSGNNFFADGTPNMFGIVGYYQSRYGQVNIRMSPRIPTGFLGGFKSYGNLSAMNPLAVRVHPDVGFGARLIVETTNDDQYPIKQVNIEMEFDIGVGMDRTNGAVAKLVSGGVYGNPTIG